jgi:hypothetical protein
VPGQAAPRGSREFDRRPRHGLDWQEDSACRSLFGDEFAPDDGKICGLTPAQLAIVIKHYEKHTHSAEGAIYTPEFGPFLWGCHVDGFPIHPADLAAKSIAIRKEGLLPWKPREKKHQSVFEREHEGLLIYLYKSEFAGDKTGDRIAYTPEFVAMAAEFRWKTGKPWSDRDIFRELINLRRAKKLSTKGRGGPGKLSTS